MIGYGDHHVVRPCRTDVVDTSDIESFSPARRCAMKAAIYARVSTLDQEP
jgi:hypothetical protein